jgi:hypothetical protein
MRQGSTQEEICNGLECCLEGRGDMPLKYHLVKIRVLFCISTGPMPVAAKRGTDLSVK